MSLQWSLVAAAFGGPDEDPFSMFAGWDTGQLLVLAALLPIAISVFWYGSRQFSRQRGGSALRPRGRPFFSGGGPKLDAAWRQTVARLEAVDPSAIARASSGAVRIEGTIVNASGNLGGEPGRECVWRNRAGARAESAVGAEIVVVADDTGRCGVENLERARVIAPAERHGQHWENVSLYLGDRVELVGQFAPERTGDDPDETKLVYGTLGADGPLQVRLLHRPEPSSSESPPTSDLQSPLPSPAQS